MQLARVDARGYLMAVAVAGAPEVVYLDPLYPPRAGSALPRKEMVWLHELVGDSEDEVALLAVARRVARRHVVVKRPHAAPPISADVVREYRSKMVRFDVHAPLP